MVSRRNGACLRLADGQEFGAYLPVFLDLLFVVVKERASGYLLCSHPLGKMVALVKIS